MNEQEKTRIVTVTIPNYLVELLDKEAKRLDRSRSYLISQIISEHYKGVK